MLSLGGERLTLKVLNHYLHHDLGMQLYLIDDVLICPFNSANYLIDSSQLKLWIMSELVQKAYFAHLLILKWPTYSI